MQSEAGQDIRTIISRKEAERRAGDGLFFWGVGTAPSRAIRTLTSKSSDIDVVFSLMKSRPQAQDVTPKGVVAWQTYFDGEGIEQPIPEHVLVLSRKHCGTVNKNVHFALVCNSNDELQLTDLGSFDPTAYRNISAVGGPIGNSQVTALVVRTRDESSVSPYRVNFRAKLVGWYWVRLGRPQPLKVAALTKLSDISTRSGEITVDEWTQAVAELKSDSKVKIDKQRSLF